MSPGTGSTAMSPLAGFIDHDLLSEEEAGVCGTGLGVVLGAKPVGKDGTQVNVVLDVANSDVYLHDGIVEKEDQIGPV